MLSFKIRDFIKKLFPYLDAEVEYAWAGTFGTTRDYDPLVKFKDTTAVIAGAASQVICFMAAQHVAKKLLGKKSSLEKFFSD